MFHLTAETRAEIGKSVSSQKIIDAYGDRLYYGFAIGDIVWGLSESKERITTLVLGSALVEVYPIDVATEVLLELTRLGNTPTSQMPCGQEWKALLHVCECVLSSSWFATEAQTLMTYDHDDDG
jgi:hypothetical protein